jgi:hypothetical protein
MDTGISESRAKHRTALAFARTIPVETFDRREASFVKQGEMASPLDRAILSGDPIVFDLEHDHLGPS